MTTIRKYKDLPKLTDLDPGIIPGPNCEVVILQAEPMDKIGSIIITSQTKDDEAIASVEALLVSVAPNAFVEPDWPEGAAPPDFVPGDHVFTQRYPSGVKVIGRDDREYIICKDRELRGRRERPDEVREASGGVLLKTGDVEQGIADVFSERRLRAAGERDE